MGPVTIRLTLVYTFQCRMKQEAPSANEKVSNKGHEEDCIVTMLETVADAFCGQVHEQKIGECVDNFGSVLSNNVVLWGRIISR